jgi:carbon-monoxide dehydrogenase small subunit
MTTGTDVLNLRFELNGQNVAIDAAANDSLAYLLRMRLGMTGTKVSCDVQVCGACTVLVDDLPVSSCTYLAYEVDGRHVLTVEGLRGDDDGLNPLQRAFIDDNAFQCGYCTSGMLLAATAWLRERRNGEPTEDLLDYLSGNICRCTGYVPIVAAILETQEMAP